MKIEIEIPEEYVNTWPEVNWSYVIAHEGVEQYVKYRRSLAEAYIIDKIPKKKKHNKIDYYALAEDWYKNYYGKNNGSTQSKSKQLEQVKQFIKNHIRYLPNKRQIEIFKETFESFLATQNGHKEEVQQMREND